MSAEKAKQTLGSLFQRSVVSVSSWLTPQLMLTIVELDKTLRYSVRLPKYYVRFLDGRETLHMSRLVGKMCICCLRELLKLESPF